jgi:hypothetical protein
MFGQRPNTQATSRHADEHGKPGIDVLEAGPVGGDRAARCAGDGNSKMKLGEDRPDMLTNVANPRFNLEMFRSRCRSHRFTTRLLNQAEGNTRS